MPNMTIAIAAIAVLAGAGLFVLAPWLAPSGNDANLLRPDEPAIVAAGKEVYRANCASCHGAGLEGQPDWRSPGADGLMPAPPHDETGHTWHHADELLFAITKYGVGKLAGIDDYNTAMPVYDGVLTDDEIIAALSYIKAQWPSLVRERHDALNARVSGQEANR